MEVSAKDVRKFIYDRIRTTSFPPVLEEIMRRFELNRRQAREVLKILQADRHVVLLNGTDRILMAHPFSAVISPFRVKLNDGQEYFANCSYDSIAIHVMLGEDVTIDAFCHHCAEKISIELSDETVKNVQPNGAIVYLGLPATQWWQNIVNTCSNTMVFFASQEHLEQWLTANEIDKPGRALTIEQTIKLSTPIYKKKMDVDYERPSASELENHFNSLGLKGAFWAIQGHQQQP